MLHFTISDLRDWNACYDPDTCLPENWNGTALDMLNEINIPVQDRLWAVMRPQLLSNKDIRLFAVWCARQIDQIDNRSIAAINISENFANDSCDEVTRCTAEYDAWKAVIEAPSATATAAAKSAAHSIVSLAKSAAQGASLWASANNDPDAKAASEMAQIEQAKIIFNTSGF